MGHGDDVISRVGPFGGVWSRPGVWPGDGGWIAIPTASPSGGANPEPSGSSGYLKLYRYRKAADGTPSLDAPIQSDDAFGFSSGAPVITSEGTTSGSATLWVVWAPNGGGPRAASCAPMTRCPRTAASTCAASFPIGQSSKFAMPGVGEGRLYVGARNGHVLAFGAPVQANVQVDRRDVPADDRRRDEHGQRRLTISGTVKVNAISASGSQFAARTAGLGLGGTFTDGQTIPYHRLHADRSGLGRRHADGLHRHERLHLQPHRDRPGAGGGADRIAADRLLRRRGRRRLAAPRSSPSATAAASR